MAASAPAGGPALVDPREVVPLLAEGWSHAAVGTHVMVVPCSWRATLGDSIYRGDWQIVYLPHPRDDVLGTFGSNR